MLGLFSGTQAQAKWPVPIFFEKYGRYHRLTNDVKLFDTTIIEDTENRYFRLVLFDGRGKSYFEAYLKNQLIEKGYFENSLDTLKKYSTILGGKQNKRLKILAYFHPLKNGIWLERKNGKLIEKKYNMGIEISN